MQFTKKSLLIVAMNVMLGVAMLTPTFAQQVKTNNHANSYPIMTPATGGGVPITYTGSGCHQCNDGETTL